MRREARKYIIFAGTSEGRMLYECCEQHQIGAVFCVATEYGKKMLCKLREAKNENSKEQKEQTESVSTYPKIHVGRMSAEEM